MRNFIVVRYTVEAENYLLKSTTRIPTEDPEEAMVQLRSLNNTFKDVEILSTDETAN